MICTLSSHAAAPDPGPPPGQPDSIEVDLSIPFEAAFEHLVPRPATRGPESVIDPSIPRSHEKFLEALSHADRRLATQLRQRYRSYLDTHEDDIGTTVEYCRFLAEAGCTDLYGDCPFYAESQSCFETVLAAHPQHPQVQLVRLERMSGEAAARLARSLASSDLRSWNDRDRAILHATIAYQALQDSEPTSEAIEHAAEAMRLDPEQDLSLLAAEAAHALGQDDWAIELLDGRLEPSDSNWQLEQKIELLLKLGAVDQAYRAFDVIRESGDEQPDWVLHAQISQSLGRYDEARASLDTAGAAAEFEWRQPTIHALRMRLELDHGTADTAIAYYDAYRDGGSSDPFLQDRVRMHLSHPSAPWRLRDAWGALGIGLMLLGFGLAPLSILAPIHYFGLWRRTQRAHPEARISRFRLRHAWWALAVLLISEVPFFYVDGAQPLLGLDQYFSETLESAEFDTTQLSSRGLAFTAILTSAICLAGLAPLRHRVSFRISDGHWSVKKTLRWVFGSLVGLRFGLGLWLLITPASWHEQGIAQRSLFDLEAITSLVTLDLPAVSLTEFVVAAVATEYGVLAMLAWLAIAVPIIEELAFRGALLGGLQRYVSFNAANAIQATVFALFHEELSYFPFYLGLALLAGWMARAAGTLAAPILLHAANNALAGIALASQLGT